VTLSVVIMVLGLVLAAGHFLLAWAERRGWGYCQSTDRPRPRSLGLFEEIYQPSISHVIDQQMQQETEADQSARADRCVDVAMDAVGNQAPR
jgi:hypothetical protein